MFGTTPLKNSGFSAITPVMKKKTRGCGKKPNQTYQGRRYLGKYKFIFQHNFRNHRYFQRASSPEAEVGPGLELVGDGVGSHGGPLGRMSMGSLDGPSIFLFGPE